MIRTMSMNPHTLLIIALPGLIAVVALSLMWIRSIWDDYRLPEDFRFLRERLPFSPLDDQALKRIRHALNVCQTALELGCPHPVARQYEQSLVRILQTEDEAQLAELHALRIFLLREAGRIGQGQRNAR